MTRAPNLTTTRRVKGGDLRLPANYDLPAFVQNAKRGAFYSVSDASAPLAGLGIDDDQVIAIRDDDARRIRQHEIGNALVRALVAPKDFAVASIDRADAIRSALDSLAILEARKLTAGAHIQNLVDQDRLWCQTEVFRLPVCVSSLARNCADASVPGSVDHVLIENRRCFR